MNKCSEIKVETCLTSRYIELPPYIVCLVNRSIGALSIDPVPMTEHLFYFQFVLY